MEPYLLTDPLIRRLRRYFGILQEDLARYLGRSGAQVSRLEAGLRSRSPEDFATLDVLALGLPATAPLPLTEAEVTALVAAPERAPLEARLDYCQHHARRLRRALRPLVAQATYAERWRAALPLILPALPPDPGGSEPPDLPPGRARWPAYLNWFRWRWLLSRPTTLPPDLAARYHLLRLQAEALETEAAALTALLAPPA